MKKEPDQLPVPTSGTWPFLFFQARWPRVAHLKRSAKPGNMKRHAPFAVGLFAAAYLGGCVGSRDREIASPVVAGAAINPIATDQQAIEAAAALLHRHHANWGSAIRVLRTGSGWYRIEYAHKSGEAERVVLVNPSTGEGSFPMPR